MRRIIFTAASVVAIAFFGVGCGNAELCADGEFGGEVTLTADGFVREFVDNSACLPGTICPLKRELIHYRDNPFLNCRRIGGILFSGGLITDEYFPVLEDLGGISGIDALDAVDDVVPERIDGFDSVVRLGSLGNFIEVAGFNSVTDAGVIEANRILGFSSLERMTGPLTANDVSGLVSLQEVFSIEIEDGLTDSITLPRLETVVGDVSLINTVARTISLPRLALVSGTFQIGANRQMVTMADLEPGHTLVLEGLTALDGNLPIEDQDFSDWISRNGVVASGQVIICHNGVDPTTDC